MGSHLHFFFIISVNFLPFWLLFGYFGKKTPNSCRIFAFQLWVGLRNLPPSLPPVIIIKIIPTIHFLDIYRVCVLPGQSKFVMVAVRIIIKPLCFSMMNKILSISAILATFLAIFGKKKHIKLPCTI